jgi:hypothetical protein
MSWRWKFGLSGFGILLNSRRNVSVTSLEFSGGKEASLPGQERSIRSYFVTIRFVSSLSLSYALLQDDSRKWSSLQNVNSPLKLCLRCTTMLPHADYVHLLLLGISFENSDEDHMG